MEKATIGAILKRRVKERGYTQQRFAEVVGVKYSTLRKYMSGKAAYSYELLLIFAEELDCSVEYLLGLSKSPIKEHHEIAEQTRLSEEAISKLVKYARYYDEEFEARRYIKCLNMLLCEDGAFNSICDFFIASKFTNSIYQESMSAYEKLLQRNPTIKKLGIEDDRKLSVESQMMIDVMVRLKNLKAKMTPEFIEELKALDLEENLQKDWKKINDFFSANSGAINA